MRSPDVRLLLIVVPVLLIASLEPAEARLTGAKGAGTVPGDAEIARALDQVRADPNLATERTIKTLRWKDAETSRAPRPSRWFPWLAGFFRWIDQSARVLVWCAAALLGGLLVRWLVRVFRANAAGTGDPQYVAPTHVRDLDIRPDSLPGDIGTAARELWDRGERRAALALLYRGLLSRLAHVHGVPIRDSSTEGECLGLAARHLTDARTEYAARLVRVWQRAVYGHQDVQGGIVYGLCDEFATALDAALPAERAARDTA